MEIENFFNNLRKFFDKEVTEYSWKTGRLKKSIEKLSNSRALAWTCVMCSCRIETIQNYTQDSVKNRVTGEYSCRDEVNKDAYLCWEASVFFDWEGSSKFGIYLLGTQ
jgi:hypothetical protein